MFVLTGEGRKTSAHNPQKVGAQFRFTCGEHFYVPQVPLGESSGTASHYVRQTGHAAVGTHVSDQLTGSNRHHGHRTDGSFRDYCLGNVAHDQRPQTVAVMRGELCRCPQCPSGWI
jgi:hypothetical protein